MLALDGLCEGGGEVKSEGTNCSGLICEDTAVNKRDIAIAPMGL